MFYSSILFLLLVFHHSLGQLEGNLHVGGFGRKCIEKSKPAEHHKTVLRYAVIEGGKRDVDVTICSSKDPTDCLMWSRRQNGTISLYVDIDVIICFDNQFSWITSKRLKYSIQELAVEHEQKHVISNPRINSSTDATRISSPKKKLSGYVDSFTKAQQLLTFVEKSSSVRPFYYTMFGVFTLMIIWKAFNMMPFKTLLSAHRMEIRLPPEEIIPPELLRKVFLKLQPDELLQVRRVSKNWKDFIDNSDIWREKYKQSFKRRLPMDVARIQKMNWREMYYSRLAAEKNMLSSRPKYHVTDFFGHSNTVTCVASAWDTVVSTDQTGVLCVWSVREEILKQVLESPLPVKQLFVTKSIPQRIVAYGEHPASTNYGSIYVWCCSGSGVWSAEWNRTYFVTKNGEHIRVKSVEHVSLCRFGNLTAIVTAERTSGMVHLWNVDDYGKYVLSIQTAIKNIMAVNSNLEGDIIYIIGDNVCQGWTFDINRGAYVNLFDVLLSDFVALALNNNNWKLKLKSCSLEDQEMVMLFWRPKGRGTDFSLCRLNWDEPFSQGFVSRAIAMTDTRVCCLDFNSHIAVLGKENSSVIYFMDMNTNKTKSWITPAFINCGNVSCVSVDDEKIVVGCDDPYSVHVWDFSARTQPKDNKQLLTTREIVWLLFTNIYQLKHNKLCGRERLHSLRRWVTNTINILPILVFVTKLDRVTLPLLVILMWFCLSSSVRKSFWLIAISFSILGSQFDSEMLLRDNSNVFSYLPLLVALIVSSGIEKAMKHCSSGRAVVATPLSYFTFLLTIMGIAYYGKHQETYRDVIGSILLYDYWFLLIGVNSLIRNAPFNSHLFDLLAYIIFPYLAWLMGLILCAASFITSLLVDYSFAQEIPPMFSLSNVVLRLCLSCYAFFSNYIAIHMNKKQSELSPFVQRGGVLYIYLFLVVAVAIIC